jgi:hypothetical protein
MNASFGNSQIAIPPALTISHPDKIITNTAAFTFKAAYAQLLHLCTRLFY